jgi:hypothetical protein
MKDTIKMKAVEKFAVISRNSDHDKEAFEHAKNFINELVSPIDMIECLEFLIRTKEMN